MSLFPLKHISVANLGGSESGPALVESLQDGLKATRANASDYGLVTTPILHYIVRSLNTINSPNAYGTPTEEGYYKKLGEAYQRVLSGYNKSYSITIDAANGVGGPKVKELVKYLGGLVDINVVNDHYLEPLLLNQDCGADHVKTQQRLPAHVEPVPGKLYASFDGDADRIVFFFLDKESQFRLLDGDKIATLAASFLGDLVKQSGTDLNIGVVQTAYANGSSTSYLTNTLKVPVECTATGVKHLHHAAQHFDIGVYFEANGHGTVLFDPQAVSTLKNFKVSSPAQSSAIESLLALSDLINQTVGDALSDLLLVLAILTIQDLTPSDWDSSYTDLPNRLSKVEVKDRTIFKTTDAERRLTSPPELQHKIDSLVQKFSQGRSFVRASGTENVVRVYAEAASRIQADELALKVSHLLETYN
ncbi:hypothetical protein D0Z00_001471 [Geotrichum galactomycetum]|uniref:Uncharacterized protein n=1 Tax=Geotrichum galactomycetum TaxID=27317 RepID=A0ACB6V798_9ASCO|nr:hypothetical protein D0Z00_001471 [Geotrichum candidum]